MTAEELQFLDVGALAAYVQDLYDNGSTQVIVTALNKSWYLLQYD